MFTLLRILAINVVGSNEVPPLAGASLAENRFISSNSLRWNADHPSSLGLRSTFRRNYRCDDFGPRIKTLRLSE